MGDALAGEGFDWWSSWHPVQATTPRDKARNTHVAHSKRRRAHDDKEGEGREESQGSKRARHSPERQGAEPPAQIPDELVEACEVVRAAVMAGAPADVTQAAHTAWARVVLSPHLDGCVRLVVGGGEALSDEQTMTALAVLATPSLSHRQACCVVAHTARPKVAGLQGAASRVLLTSLVRAVEVHPEPVVAELVLPVATDVSGLGTAQAEVLCRLVKEKALEPHFNGLLREFLSICEQPWTDLVCTVLQALVMQRPQLEPQTCLGFCEALDAQSVRLSDSAKFASLLFHSCKLGTQILPHATKLEAAIGRCSNFMAKSAAKALHKLLQQ